MTVRDWVPPADAGELGAYLAGKRVFLDVSVLLSGLLVEDSDSRLLLTMTDQSTVLLSDHVEERARVVLRRGSPQLLGVFGDGLLRLSQLTRLVRVGRGERDELPAWCETLDDEDRQVIADAVLADADILFNQDHEFFKGRIRGLIMQTPSSLVWPLRALKLQNVRCEAESWTFFGWFVPNWGSAQLHNSDERFFVFEVADHIACFYEPRSEAFQLRWRTRSGASGTLRYPQSIEYRSYNFVSVAVAKDRVLLFVNGAWRDKPVRLGPVPPNGRFSPFMSAQSRHHIFGGCQFRVEARTISAGLITKHWRARTVRLTDREIELDNMIGPFLHP